MHAAARAIGSVMLIAAGAIASAANLPPAFSESAVTGGNVISQGTAIEFSPDGRLFVLEQAGTIQVYEQPGGGGAGAWTRVQADFFADTPLNVDSNFERGLLGIAFDPDFAVNRFVYVYYTTAANPPRNRIARYTANAQGDRALAGSARTLMNLEPLGAGNHNGGAMHFGPDGKLYVAVGENAQPANAQSITTRKGKILRLNPDPDHPVPADNPRHIAGIAGATHGVNRAIWAAGLRNPYTFAFKPGTNVMFINDVGAQTWEEINVGRAGANYGWGATEGPFSRLLFPNFRPPIVYYHHNNPALSSPHNAAFRGSAITGGVFYASNNPTFPMSYRDDYFFADYVAGWIRRYDRASRTVRTFATGIGGPVSLTVGSDGALYYLARDAVGFGSGRVFRVQRGGQ